MIDLSDDDAYVEAIAEIIRKKPQLKSVLANAAPDLRARAFTVAGVTDLQVVTDVWQSIQDGIQNKTSFEDWQASVGPKLEEQWGGKKPGRLETIWRTNLQSAFSAARWRQMNDPLAKELRPYVQFDATIDTRTSDVCYKCAGTIAHLDSDWVRSHTPPLHFNCRSSWITLDEEEAAQAGITTELPEDLAQSGFGRPPPDDAPDHYQPDLDSYPDTIREAFEESGKCQIQPEVPAAIEAAVPARVEPVGVLPRGGLDAKKAKKAKVEILEGDRPASDVWADVFGEDAPALDALEQYQSVGKSKVKAKAVSVDTTDGNVQVVFNLNKGKKQIGYLVRTFSRVDGVLVVSHERIGVDPEYQGQGIASDILAQSVEAYRELGVKKIVLSTAKEGRYVWAGRGFKWSAEEAANKRIELQRYLTRTVGIDPERAASIAADVASDPAKVAALMVDGKHVGKPFLLQADTWEGEREIT